MISVDRLVYRRMVAVVLCLGMNTCVGAQGRAIVRMGKDVYIEVGRRVESAVAIGGDVIVEGRVTTDAVAVGGSVIVEPTGYVVGSAVAVGGEIRQSPGSVVRGDLVEINTPWAGRWARSVPRGVWVGAWWIMRVLVFIGFAALALIIVALFPRQIHAVSDNALSATAHSLLWGLAAVVAAVPLAVLLAISILGIPLIPFEFVLLGLGVVGGYIAISRLIGARLVAITGRRELSMVWETLIGLFLLFVIGLIPVFGWIVRILVALWGMGAVIETFVRIRRQNRPVQTG